MLGNKKIKVLIVDDSNVVRDVFSKLLSDDPEITVVGTAVDVMDARQKIKTLNPDVVTLDIEMPGMDGISFLEKIMTLRPTPVIMISTLTQKGTDQTIRALEIGAVDCIGKPYAQENRDTLPLLQNQLISKVKIASKAQVKSFVLKPGIVDNNIANIDGVINPNALIAIGSSTGGVEAIKVLLENMPNSNIVPPIVIAQHMPEGFTASFAKRMATVLSKNMKEAEDQEILKSGYIYIAPGNKHLRITKSGSKYMANITSDEIVGGHRPSVDVMFNSIANNIDCKNVVAAILTGMGRDGSEGLLKMKEKGAFTIGQSEDSCVVYGMPKAAKKIGATMIELPINKISAKILKECTSK